MREDEFLKRFGNIEKPKEELIIDIKREKIENKEEAFLNSLNLVGAEGIVVKKDNLEEEILKRFKNSKKIASIYSFSFANVNPNLVNNPKELEDIDVSVVKGEFGVCENGAVWIEERENIHRAVYFICKDLVILLKRENLIDSMHEAYKRIDPKISYGIFISGPSKTADIEQALVIGAHGAKSLTVFLIDE